MIVRGDAIDIDYYNKGCPCSRNKEKWKESMKQRGSKGKRRKPKTNQHNRHLAATTGQCKKCTQRKKLRMFCICCSRIHLLFHAPENEKQLPETTINNKTIKQKQPASYHSRERKRQTRLTKNFVPFRFSTPRGSYSCKN